MNLTQLDNLSEAEKKIALQILKQYQDTGKSKIMEQIMFDDYDEIPVDIETFLHDRNYLGNGLYDNDGRFTLYPYWEKKLKEIFPDNVTTAYNTIIFSGAIGIGKTLVADIILLYMLYRLLCLKDPYTYFGMQLIDKISISFMNVTIENAKGVALDKLNQLILASPWFMKHGEMSGTTNLIYRPEKHIELIAASSNNQIVGRAILANFSDECNFALFNNPEKQKKKMMKIITQVDARMKSRYMRTRKDGTPYLPTINILASSKDTEQSFLEAYIENKRQTESKNTLIVDEPQWVVDERKNSPKKFYVAIGNKFLANELLPTNVTEEELDEYRSRGYQLWKVPIGYLDTFQLNLDEAICSIIGIATASSLKYISGVKLNQIKTDTYKNPFTKDVIKLGTQDSMQYSDFFDMSLVRSEDRSRPLFIHLDLSTSGDKTGIAGVWITGKKNYFSDDQSEQGNTNSSIEQTSKQTELNKDLQFKLAFSVSIQAPRGSQVSFAKTRNFIRWLKQQGFSIKKITMDTFQSATIKQDLDAEGFKTDILSVDRLVKDANGHPICLPYYFLKSVIYEKRLTIYAKCDQLTDELIGLERKSDGHIDHTKDGIDEKDQSDAVCGAVYSASQHAEEFAYDYGESYDNMNSAVSVNTEMGDAQQITINFEEELAKMFNPLQDQMGSLTNQQPFNSYLYLQDGIIV